MAELDIGAAQRTDYTNQLTSYSVNSKITEGAEDQDETIIDFTKFPTWYGYYRTIPELAAAIDARAVWTVGKGFRAKPLIEAMLNRINGYGKDTFNTILENMIRTYYINGDSFAEIIRDNEGFVINLKPLDPHSMRVILNRQGRIKRYEQISKVGKYPKKFDKDKIFHLSRNRTADEGKGISIVENLEKIILMRNEAMDNLQKVFLRYVKPRFNFKIDSDTTADILTYKTLNEEAVDKGEDIYTPKDLVEAELIAVAPNATLNPLPWIENLNNYFWQATGGTDIVVGANQAITEGNGKMKYLAFQQNVEKEQLYIEEQVGLQLGMEIELDFPASIENDLLSDRMKDGGNNLKRSDTTAGSGQ